MHYARRIAASAIEALNALLVRARDHVLPAQCILCGLYCGTGNICQPCFGELPRAENSCRQCARSGLSSQARLCGACLHRPPPWDEALAALLYEYPVNHLVKHFKFRRNLVCGQLLAEEMIRRISDSNARLPAAVLPVPLHLTRRFSRGFNQAEFLARQLGLYFGIPVRYDRLRRTKWTSAQSGLDGRQRRKNVRDAFSCRSVSGLTVALVDDVLTTGATLSACSRTVRAAGASHIAVWVAARVPGILIF